MKLSYRWLARHVDLAGITPADLARELTLRTAEVEGLERFAPHLDDVIVGHVTERAPHPGADKLSVCRVDVGAGEPLAIVCGAPNVAAGQRVAVARIGTRLPGELVIKKAKIRGVESCGMICSLRELDLGDEHDGIWVLEGQPTLGRPVSEALDLVDWVLEIDNKSITHRPDLWGHRGMAAEVAATFGLALRPLDLSLPPTGAGPGVPVRIESPACPRYVALSIDGARPGPAPAWMRHLLLAVGQRPLDVLVDVSNFVMLDLGQPNHVFDRARLSAQGIVVRMARPGERMKTLDGFDHTLTAEDLLICDGPEPIALAGVMGGEGSKVGADTSRLLLEVANFHPTTIRRTAVRLGTRTDASARFEKSLDPNLPLAAAAHFVRLLQAIQPGVSLPAPATDAGDWTDPACTLELRPARVRRLLGIERDDATIAADLGRLGFGVRAEGERFLVNVPAARATKDIELEVDLVEEVGRLLGYGAIPERKLVAEIEPPPLDARRDLVRALQDRLAGGARFHEVLTYSFVPDSLLEALGLRGLPHVEIVNPVAEGERSVRRSLLPNLLGVVAKNRRLVEDVRLFEIGKGYLPEESGDRGQPREVHEAALVWAGPRPPAGARFDAARLQRLQGVVQDLLVALGLPEPVWEAAGELGSPFHPAKALAALLPGPDGAPRAVAWVGELEPGLARPLGLVEELAGELALARISLDLLLASPRRGSRYRPIPRFPLTKLDVALAAPEALRAGELEAAIRAAGKGLVDGLELFDLYSGPNLGAGRRSLAWHVVLRAEDRTLGEADVQKFLGRLERGAAELGAELRRE